MLIWICFNSWGSLRGSKVDEDDGASANLTLKTSMGRVRTWHIEGHRRDVGTCAMRKIKFDGKIWLRCEADARADAAPMLACLLVWEGVFKQVCRNRETAFDKSWAGLRGCTVKTRLALTVLFRSNFCAPVSYSRTFPRNSVTSWIKSTFRKQWSAHPGGRGRE